MIEEFSIRTWKEKQKIIYIYTYFTSENLKKLLIWNEKIKFIWGFLFKSKLFSLFQNRFTRLLLLLLLKFEYLNWIRKIFLPIFIYIFFGV